MKDIDKKTKRLTYLALFDFFGAELGAFIALAAWCISCAIKDSWTIDCTWYGAIGTLIAMGTVFGFWAGPVAWQKIYIEGIRGKKYILK